MGRIKTKIVLSQYFPHCYVSFITFMDGKWVRQKPNFVLLNIFMISVFGGLASIPRDRGAMNASALSKASKLPHCPWGWWGWWEEGRSRVRGTLAWMVVVLSTRQEFPPPGVSPPTLHCPIAASFKPPCSGSTYVYCDILNWPSIWHN